MVEKQLRGRGIADQRVLDAMARIPRERFVTGMQRPLAYADEALPIDSGQTISQPYIVARMTELLLPSPATGSWRWERAPATRRPCWPRSAPAC